MLNEELETFIMASIQALKRSNKKCGKDRVFKLVNNSLEKEISKEMFESLLCWLTEEQSVKLNVLGKRSCLSLPKESQLNKESNLIVCTGSKEDKEYHCDIINENEVTERVNAINNDSSKSEESSLEDFRTFKKSFITGVNVFKKQLLTSYTTDNVNKSNNSDRLIILLEKNIAFLKEQISKKDKVSDSLLNQLSKQNVSAPHNKTSNTISIQTELIADSKSTESFLKN